jgi:shikimate kinase
MVSTTDYRDMSIQRIYLVGFMGAGKSTVGRELSLKLRWRFLDLDAEIEKSANLPVREIFAQLGEPHFRQLESRHLQRVSETSQAIIALGGGAYVDAANRAIVDNTGVAVWLDTSLATVKERVRPDGSRPLLADAERARQLYTERLPSYRLARIHVLTDNRLPDAIAEEIVQKVANL